MKPLYQALICFLVKLVFSIRKSRSSFDSFCLLLDPPIYTTSMTSQLLWLRQQQQQHGPQHHDLETLQHVTSSVVETVETLRRPLLPYSYSYKASCIKPPFVFLTPGHSDTQGWASECPDVKNYKWRQLNPVWHGMLYSCTHVATVGAKGLNRLQHYRPGRHGCSEHYCIVDETERSSSSYVLPLSRYRSTWNTNHSHLYCNPPQ